MRVASERLRSALELLVTAAGVLFLASGLRQWAAVAWTDDTTAARTPVAYGTRVVLPPEAHALPPTVKWVIALSDTGAASACAAVARQSAHGEPDAPVGIVATGGISARVAVCSADSQGRRHVTETAAVRRPLGWVPTSGFIVTDRTGRVVYGSFDLAVLAHALRSLALLE